MSIIHQIRVLGALINEEHLSTSTTTLLPPSLYQRSPINHSLPNSRHNPAYTQPHYKHKTPTIVCVRLISAPCSHGWYTGIWSGTNTKWASVLCVRLGDNLSKKVRHRPDIEVTVTTNIVTPLSVEGHRRHCPQSRTQAAGLYLHPASLRGAFGVIFPPPPIITIIDELSVTESPVIFNYSFILLCFFMNQTHLPHDQRRRLHNLFSHWVECAS